MSDDLDTAGMATSAEPIEGGVCILNAAVAPGHDDHEVWRAQTNDELDAGAKARVADADQQASKARAYLRLERNRLLAASDWTQLPDAPITDAERVQVAAWRDEMRTFPIDTLPDADNPPPFPSPPALLAAADLTQ